MAARDYELLLKISADIRNAVGPLNQVSRDLRKTAKQGSDDWNKAYKRIDAGFQKLTDRGKLLKAALTGLFAVAGVRELTKQVVDANIAMQRIHYGLEQAFGSSKAADAQFKFLSETSQRLGLNLKDVSEGYVQIATSAQGTGVSTQALQKVFVGMSEAATVLHTSTADVAGVFTQLSQGISLGKLQMQDIKAISQHLPGTMNVLKLAAQRLGTTLKYSLAHGGLDAQRMLESIGVVLHERFGPRAAEASKSLNAEINRLKTAIFNLETAAGANGFLASFTQSVRDLTQTLNDPGVKRGFSGLMQAMGAALKVALKLGQAIGGVTNAVDYITRKYAASKTGYIDQSQPLKDQQEQFNAMVAKHRANQKELKILEKNDVSSNGQPGSRLVALRKADAALLKEIMAAQEAHKQAIIRGQKETQDALAQEAGNFIDSIIGSGKGGGGGPDKAAIARAKRRVAAQLQLANIIDRLGSQALGPVTKLWNDYTTAVREAAKAGATAIANGADVGQVQAQVAKAVQLAGRARAEAEARLNRGLKIKLYQAQGDTAAAATAQIEQQYGQMLKDMEAKGDAAGAAIVRKLINVEKARTQLQALQAQIDRVLSAQSRTEQNIQAEQSAGLISEYTARQQILDLHKRTAAELDQLLPKYRALAEATGDPRAIARMRDLESEVGRLKLKANQLKQAFDSGLTDGLTRGLKDLATGATNVAGAFREMANAIINALVQVAARELAAKAISAGEGLFGGKNKSAGKDVGQGAEKLGIASLLLGVNAGKLMAAAQALLVANTVGSTSGGSGLFGFATGGEIRGPGTGTSDSILARVSRGEFIQRAAAVDYYGSSFMHALNNLQLPRFAGGGLIGADVPMLSAPRSPRRAAAGAGQGGRAAAPVMLRINNLVDPHLVSDHLKTTQGEQDVLNIIRNNRSTVRQAIS